MQRARIIAIGMLLAFAANFTVFCHCATAVKHSCCCEKPQKRSGPCHGTQAVQFNLAEKQLADCIQAAPLPVVFLHLAQPAAQRENLPPLATANTVKHPPPDILTLHQRLLI